jgi:hypothetical protein
MKDGSLRFKEPKTKAGRRTITIPAVTVQMLCDHRTDVWKRRLALGLGKAQDQPPPRTQLAQVTLSTYAHFFEQDDSSAALAIGRLLG